MVTAVAPFSKGVTEAAARGWEPISANFLMPAWVKSHWPKYVEGCDAPAGLRIRQTGALPRAFRRQGRSNREGLRHGSKWALCYYYRSLFTKLKRRGRIELFKTRRDQPDDEVTLESICDKLIIRG